MPVDLASDPLEASWHGDPADVVDAWAELLEAIERPWWHQHAACRGQGADRWFPARGEDVRPLKAACATCTVRRECEDSEAWQHDGLDGGGIWAGTSTGIRRSRRSTAV